MAKEVPQMVRGLGMAVRFLTLLTDELTKRGGHEEMIHFLTTERGADTLGKVADFIANMEWQLPRSLAIRMAREAVIDEFGDDPEYIEQVETYSWVAAVHEFRIPSFDFAVGYKTVKSDERPLPTEIYIQLAGKPAKAGTVVNWEDKQYVVTELAYVDEHHGTDLPDVGEEIEGERLGIVSVAPAYRFNLNR